MCTYQDTTCYNAQVAEDWFYFSKLCRHQRYATSGCDIPYWSSHLRVSRIQMVKRKKTKHCNVRRTTAQNIKHGITVFVLRIMSYILGIMYCVLPWCAYNIGPRSAVGNVSGYRCVSDCRSRGREFDPGPVPYFRGDWSWNNFYGHSPPFRWYIQEGLLSVTSESMCTNYWLTACSSLPRKKCG